MPRDVPPLDPDLAERLLSARRQYKSVSGPSAVVLRLMQRTGLPVGVAARSFVMVAELPVAAFDCPNCGAHYKVARIESDPTEPDQGIRCLICGGSLAGREGRFIFKYFLTSKVA